MNNTHSTQALHHLIAAHYEAHRDEMVRYASAVTGDIMLSEDLVQEVFLRLLSWSHPIMISTLRPLAFTILRRLIADCQRRRHVKEHYLEMMMQQAECDTSLSSSLLMGELKERIEQALRRVPQPCHCLYRLHLFYGMGTGELTNITGLPYRTVERRLGKARKEVRQALLPLRGCS